VDQFQTAIKTGTKRQQLEALRDLLTDRLSAAPASAVASISRELLTVIKELGYLEVTREGSKADELAARRADRIARAKDQ
jgi:hypothetical protein